MAWNWQELSCDEKNIVYCVIECMMIIKCLLLSNYVSECRFRQKAFYKAYGSFGLYYYMQNIQKILVAQSSKNDEKMHKE